MTRPPLEIADLIRTAGAAFVERNRHMQVARGEKLSTTRGDPAFPGHSAVISMSACAVDIVPPSRTTAAVIAIVPSARPLGRAA